MRRGESWRDDLDLTRRWHRHVQLGARHALDKRMCGPRALLELQLPPLDLQIVPAIVEPLELYEQLTGTVLGIDRPRRRAQYSKPQPQHEQIQHFGIEQAHR